MSHNTRLHRDAGRETRHRTVVRFASAAQVTDEGTFEGYASVFGAMNSFDEIFVKGAFDSALRAHAEAGTRPKGLYQHNVSEPILTWTELREDERGLFCKGRLILEVQRAREAHALMKAGELDGLSIGFIPVAVRLCPPGDLVERYGIDPAGLPQPSCGSFVMMHEAELHEISLVTFPADLQARVKTVRTAPAPAADPDADLSALAAALAARERRISRLARALAR